MRPSRAISPAAGAAVLETFRESRPERGKIGLALHRAGQVDEDRAGNLEIARVGTAPHGSEAGGRRSPFHRPEEARLADPRFTRQQEETTTIGGDLRDPSIGEVQEIVAADEEGTDERSKAVHRESLGDGGAGSWVMGHGSDDG